MSIIEYNFSLDMNERFSQTYLNVERGDIGSKLVVSFTDGDTPITLNSGMNIVFAAIKPDGNAIYNSCEIDTTANAAVYEFTEQTANVIGITACQFIVGETVNNIKASPIFRMDVQKRVVDEGSAIISSDEFGAVTEYSLLLQSLINEIQLRFDEKVDKTQTIAGISLQGNISTEQLFNALDLNKVQLLRKRSAVYVYGGQPGLTDLDSATDENSVYFIQERPNGKDVGYLRYFRSLFTAGPYDDELQVWLNEYGQLKIRTKHYGDTEWGDWNTYLTLEAAQNDFVPNSRTIARLPLGGDISPYDLRGELIHFYTHAPLNLLSQKSDRNNDVYTGFGSAYFGDGYYNDPELGKVCVYSINRKILYKNVYPPEYETYTVSDGIFTRTPTYNVGDIHAFDPQAGPTNYYWYDRPYKDLTNAKLYLCLKVEISKVDDNTIRYDYTWKEFKLYSEDEVNTLLAAKENISNKVTSLSLASTDDQYPTAKCVYDMIGDIESLLAEV